MDPDQQQKVVEFCSITGANAERAEFFLQASGWDISVGVSTFFETDGGSDVPEEMDALPPRDGQEGRTPSPPEPQAAAAPGAVAAAPPAASRPPPRSQPSSRIQTLFSSGGSQQASDDKSEEGQAYYAGGSETSGQQIVGPPRDRRRDHVAEELFKAARQHGAEEVAEAGRGGARNLPSHFVGTGYRLGESESEASSSVAGTSRPKPPMPVVLRLWKNGFTINDEPIRPFDDPQNRQFLSSIQKGEIPQELVSKAEGGQVELDMEDHRDEDYVAPKQPKVKAFAGSGQALGSQTSSSSALDGSSASQVSVNTSQPTTQIQIRLANGSRLVAKFNHTHTVGDLRGHIVASRPEYAGVPFSLHATFPSRELKDDNMTLKDADLLNASVMQRV